MADRKSVTPGYVVVYPNRDKATSKMTRAVVVLILLASVVLMLILTLGGWSKLSGLKGVNLIWCALYLGMAFFIWTRWSRGLLPMAAALGILLLVLCVIAGTGLAGTGWFDRNHFGFAAPHTIFGGKGPSSDVLGTVTVLLIPIQALLIVVTMLGFSQGWNVEREVPKDEAKGRGKKSKQSSSPEPATA